MPDLPFLVVPALVSAIACTAGARRVDRRVAIAVAILASAAIGIWVSGWRISGVQSTALIQGIVLGSVMLGAVPVLAYYGLGRTLHRHPKALAVTWLVSLAPLLGYVFLATLLTANLVACLPDQYECPI